MSPREKSSPPNGRTPRSTSHPNRDFGLWQPSEIFRFHRGAQIVMRLEGAKSMIPNDTKTQKEASSPARWFGNLPRRIRPEEGVDPRLAGFPANLLYSQIADPEADTETAKLLLMMCAFDSPRLLGDKKLCKKVRAVWYYPDPASYIENAHKRLMQYRSRKGGDYSITVRWDKDQNR